MMFRSVLMVALVGAASAFAPLQMMNRRWSAQKAQMLGDVDTMCIINAAEYCSLEDGACHPEEEQALLNRLESQAHGLEVRLDEMRYLVFALTDRPRLSALDTHQMAGPVLDEMDTMCIMNAAQYCAEEECPFEDKEALVNRLHHEYTAWNLRLLDILSTMRRLEAHVYQTSDRLHNREVDSLMQSIENALTMDYEMNNNKVPTGSFE